MNTTSKEEESYYIEMLKAAIDIASEGCANAYEKTPEIIVASVFEKIASPLVYLRHDLAKGKESLQGDFSHETPGVNDRKEPENENTATIGYGRKARLLAEGWRESKNPDIVFKTAGNTTFFEDIRTGQSWISKHAEAEK